MGCPIRNAVMTQVPEAVTSKSSVKIRVQRVGDIMSMDEAGYVTFVDRTVDTIRHKGYRVSSSEIEAVLPEGFLSMGKRGSSIKIKKRVYCRSFDSN